MVRTVLLWGGSMAGIGTAEGRRRILGLLGVAAALSTTAACSVGGRPAPVAAVPASCRQEAESYLVSFVHSTFTDCRTLSNAAVAGVQLPWILRACMAKLAANGRIENPDNLELGSPVCQECQSRLKAFGGSIGLNGELGDDADTAWALRRLVREYQDSLTRHVPLPTIGS